MNKNKLENKVGFISSLLLVVFTLITFGFALTAIPISGSFCPTNCVEYPYLNTVQQFPGDFIWMYFTIFQLITFLVVMVSLHYFAPDDKKIFSLTSLMLAALSAVVLLSCYFIQFSVIPASLVHGEFEGIPLLIQYNSHGIFIALEELGYILMVFSFLFIAFIFNKNKYLEKSIKWIFDIAFILSLLAFVIVTMKNGYIRQDIFEVFIISITWLTMIINGILIAILFRKKYKTL